jgi:lysozyme
MNGIDVSHNNGIINWDKVAQNPTKIDFAYIKVSEGVNCTDASFHFNATEAKRVGIKIGYYHFATLNTTDDVPDARSEADDFTNLLKAAPPADLPPVLDIELNKVCLDKPHVLEWINSFYAEMSADGYTNTILYSYASFLDSNLPADHNLGNIPLWLAGYVDAAKLKLPQGWNKYTIWQYSSQGSITGINGNVDLNTAPAPFF